MSHFLRESEASYYRTVRASHAAVRVEVRAGHLWVGDGGIYIPETDRSVSFAPLPKRVKILSEDGEIRSAGRFWVSLDTFDPFHLVMDLSEENERRVFGGM